MKSITLCYFAFILGLVIELLLVTRSPFRTVSIVCIGFAISLIGLLPSRRSIPFEERLELWPIMVVLTTIATAIYQLRKHIDRTFDNGASLVFGITYVYWLFEHQRLWEISTPTMAVLLAPVVLILYSALSYRRLGPRMCFLLSIFCLTVTAAFGIESALRAALMEPAEELFALGLSGRASKVLLAYFFLGTSAIYLVSRLVSLYGIIPSRADKAGDYRERLNEIGKRFSPERIRIGTAAAIIGTLGYPLAMNYRDQYLPPVTALAITLTLAPWLLMLDSGFTPPDDDTHAALVSNIP